MMLAKERGCTGPQCPQAANCARPYPARRHETKLLPTRRRKGAGGWRAEPTQAPIRIMTWRWAASKTRSAAITMEIERRQKSADEGAQTCGRPRRSGRRSRALDRGRPHQLRLVDHKAELVLGLGLALLCLQTWSAMLAALRMTTGSEGSRASTITRPRRLRRRIPSAKGRRSSTTA